MADSALKTGTERIGCKIKELGEGAVFTPKDFLDLASRGLIDVPSGGW